MNSDELIERLAAYGADIPGIMDRFAGDMELYRECLDMLVNDEGFEKLRAALEARDFGRAFDVAHALKGAASNMGVTPLLCAICDIVESLRDGQQRDCSAEYAAVTRQLAVLAELLN